MDLAKWARSQRNIDISHVLIQKVERVSGYQRAIRLIKRQGICRLSSAVVFALLTKAELVLLRRRYRIVKDHFQYEAVDSIISDSLSITPVVSETGNIFQYDNDDLEKIRALDFDLLIRCGTGILRGEILSVAKHGIVSFHHADNRVYRGSPPAFWEVFYRDETTGFTLQQLTEDLDGGNVLARGCFTTQPTYLLNQANLYLRSNFFLKKLLCDIASTNTLIYLESSYPYDGKLFTRPNVWTQIRYVCRTMVRFTRTLIDQKIFCRRDSWNVSFATTNWHKLVMRQSKRIPNPRNHFLADPFIIRNNATDYCFVEDYDYAKNLAAISVYEISDDKVIRLGEAIKEEFHLSFPYIFTFKDEYYMCPQTKGTNDIRLYRNIEFPLKWELTAVLLDDVSATDTMIFPHDDRWWMLTNIDPFDGSDHSSMLFIFFSDNPLGHIWESHRMNPVIVDPMRARNAGILYDGDIIYRVSQQHGFGIYGQGTAINRIDELTPDKFSEVKVSTISPKFSPAAQGSHHLHSNGAITVFDYANKLRCNPISRKYSESNF
ncbi:MAG: hypothetical protein CL398_11055 [Acidiferrobacteraceae bacterium]|nr:hypothetical protein [Acidiferrobacteraceae bacterium]